MKYNGSIGVPTNMMYNVGVAVVFSAINESSEHTMEVLCIERFFIISKKDK